MSTTVETRVFNFSAGPATLPLPVLEEIQADLMSYRGTGMSVMELSHRGKTFIEIQENTIARLRELLNISDDYAVLLLQGGGRLQNVMLPMNLITGPGQSADYILTGYWGVSSSEDMPHFGRLNKAFDGSFCNYSRLPQPGELKLESQAAYVHMTSNETIHGVQFQEFPSTGSVPLIVDASSELMSRPMDISKFGGVYACAQKTSGIAGCTIVILRRDLIERGGDRVPGYLSYKKHVESADLMLNTPPTFPIYVTGLICKWLQQEIGGLENMERINREKAQIVYDVLDRHSGFYRGHADRAARSLMNAVFFTPNAQTDDLFVTEARKHLLSDLKGHRVLGGIRASIYNAMPIEGAQTLAQFMNDFAIRHG